MNEVRCSVVDAVVVAIVAQALPVVYVVTQLWEILNRLDVVGFQVLMRLAHLTGIAVALKNGVSPRYIFWATASLAIIVVGALGYSLAFKATIGVLDRFAGSAVNHIRVGSPELFATNLTSARGRLVKVATLLTAIVVLATSVRGRTFELFTAMVASKHNLLRQSLGCALTRAILSLEVAKPTVIPFLFDSLSADLAPF